MKTLIEHSEHKEVLVRDEKGKDKKVLLKTLKEINGKRGEIQELRTAIQTAREQAKSQHKMVDSIMLKYVAWTLAGLTIGAMAVRQIKNA